MKLKKQQPNNLKKIFGEWQVLPEVGVFVEDESHGHNFSTELHCEYAWNTTSAK